MWNCVTEIGYKVLHLYGCKSFLFTNLYHLYLAGADFGRHGRQYRLLQGARSRVFEAHAGDDLAVFDQFAIGQHHHPLAKPPDQAQVMGNQ